MKNSNAILRGKRPPVDSPRGDKMVTMYGTVTDTQCKSCKHWSPDSALTCPAFPGGIPFDILLSKVIHDRPVAGDHGYRYEART